MWYDPVVILWELIANQEPGQDKTAMQASMQLDPPPPPLPPDPHTAPKVLAYGIDVQGCKLESTG